MTAMFRPPVAVVKSIGWAEVFGLRHGDDPFWAQVRATQLASINRYTPFNIAILGINMAALAIVVGDLGPRSLRLAWGIGVVLLCATWLHGWRLRGRGNAPSTATRVLGWIAVAKIAGFGVAWAAFMQLMMPVVDLPQQIYLVVLSLGLIGSFGFATATLPAGSIGVVALIAGGTLAAIPSASPLAAWPTALCFATFVVTVARGSLVSTFGLMSRLRTQAELGDQTEVIRLLLSEFEANGSDWLFEVDADWRLTHVSPRFAHVAGRRPEAMIGQGLLTMLGGGTGVEGGEARHAVRQLSDHLAHARPFRDAVVPVIVGGETRWWQLAGSPKRDAQGRFTGYRGVGSDITEVRLSHDRIAHLARYDPLTGLANRSLFRERLDDALARAVRTRRQCALLFIDLDRFKAVNDTLGHLAGDRLLRDVAARLRECLSGDALIGRLGGDEFAVVLPDTTLARAEAASSMIVATMSRPFAADGGPVVVGASIGFAIGPDDGDTVDKLLRSADLALYEVKETGRGSACHFVPAIKDKADERLALEADLRLALERDQFRLAYQPVVDAADERIVGFEALLRWHHPVLGLVPPLKFIPIAEETGLIVDIGAWVIRAACAQAARWPRRIRVAVNLSPVQFGDDRLADVVRSALADHKVAPDRLELEITESLFLNEQPRTVALLAALKALGIRFALDDFGTGYSSLGYLQKVDFSRIKIDRSFVSRSTSSASESVAIIQAIVALATSLGMTTTAEGTETREEFEVIRSLGCLQVQGYLFGRPMGADEATALVAEPPRLRAVG